jgi:hypothetical protein
MQQMTIDDFVNSFANMATILKRGQGSQNKPYVYPALIAKF